MKALLILEDGTVFEGIHFGAEGEASGEIVFNTAMTGYQEILTDPSYKGEIVTMTYPLIGNYGLTREDVESYAPHVNGFIVREFCDYPSNWRMQERLENYLKANNISGITGLDTRALTKRLRTKGTMKGIITTDDSTESSLIQRAKELPELSGQDLVRQVTCQKIEIVEADDAKYSIVLIDCGAKRNIIRSLVKRGCKVTIVPATITAQKILSYNPDGVMISNGPGDPQDAYYVVDTVKELMGKKPIFGICLGHQIIGLACGADTYKLKFGHRGANHPVKNLDTGRVHITTQNHGFGIRADSIDGLDIEVTHLNSNDNTIEGLRHKKYPVFSVQYHPEASPGPHDSYFIFDELLKIL